MKKYFCPEITIEWRFAEDIVTTSPSEGDNLVGDDEFDEYGEL